MMAARLSDRYDEYVKTAGENGRMQFEGEALHWFQLFRDAINEAYFDISRGRMSPQVRVECELGEERLISMVGMLPQACTICGVYRADGMTDVPYVFHSRAEIEVVGAKPGETVLLEYHYLPERLVDECDEPVFPESEADPSVYVSLAVARMWQSERKLSAAQYWLGEYYQKLRAIRSGLMNAQKRRMKGRAFR